MIFPFGLATIVCFLIGVAAVVTLTMRGGVGRTEGALARVLYEVEHRRRRH